MVDLKEVGGSVAEAVKRTPPQLWGLEFAPWSSIVGFVVDQTESGYVFLTISPVFLCHKFHSTFIHTHLIHYIRSCDGASGVVGRHPYYSQTFNLGASSHLIPRPGPVSDTS